MRSESDMEQLATDAVDHGIVAWVACDARFGWIVRAKTPFHEAPIVLRTPDDLMVLLSELFQWEGECSRIASLSETSPGTRSTRRSSSTNGATSSGTG
jgi:hypothetical protein